MILITSSIYSDQEIINEIGKLPPCFLPLANKPLLYYQIEELRKLYNDKIFITIPSNFNFHNKSLIEREYNVKFIELTNMSLKDSILNVINENLNKINMNERCDLKILYGDTLIYDIPKNVKDFMTVSDEISEFNWKYEKKYIINGFFYFSDIKKFMYYLINSKDFLSSIELYKLNKIKVNKWFDFGHLQTFFNSRKSLTTQRFFNEMKISKNVIVKKSLNKIKINAEREWYRNIPNNIKKYTPMLLDFDDGEYTLKYINALPLNELYVNGRKNKNFWLHIFDLLKDLIKEQLNKNFDDNIIKKITDDSVKLYCEKTIDRLDKFINEQTIINLNNDEIDNIYKIANDCINRTLKMKIIPGYLHGDLCLSNILYDSRNDDIVILDPRGLNANNEMTIYGDLKYDIAKLFHSFIGFYDFIISSEFEINNFNEIYFVNDYFTKEIREAFLKYEFIDGFKNIEILPLTILLFLSMLPLHKDKPLRQKAMLLNAIRLYNML